MNKLQFMMIQMIVLLFCFCNQTTKKDMAHTELSIHISTNKNTFFIGETIPITITLKNESKQAVLVNSRLSLGYEKSISRELYASIINTSTDKEANYNISDINRDDPKSNDYQWLSSNDSLLQIVDLQRYYPFENEGVYELIIYYNADEDFRTTPKEVVKGVFQSNRLKIRLAEH